MEKFRQLDEFPGYDIGEFGTIVSYKRNSPTILTGKKIKMVTEKFSYETKTIKENIDVFTG